MGRNDPEGTRPPRDGSKDKDSQDAVNKVGKILEAPEGFEDTKKDPKKP